MCMNLEYPDLAKGMVLIGPAVVSNPETVTPVKVSSGSYQSSFFRSLPVTNIFLTCIGLILLVAGVPGGGIYASICTGIWYVLHKLLGKSRSIRQKADETEN